MASKETLSDQLTLTAKMAAQVERMAAAADRIERSYDTQIAAAQKLSEAFNQINAQGVSDNLQVLNRTLKEVSDQMEEVGKTSESAFRKMGKKAEETGRSFSQKFPRSVLVATAALSGLKQGFSNLVALGKGVTGFVGSVVDGLANITASIIAIPLKIFQGLVDMAARAGSGSTELAQAMEALRKQFGAFYGPSNKAILETTRTLKGFAATGLSAWRVFGTMAERLNYIREMATEMGTSFNLLRKEFEENGGALLAYRKGLGLTSEAMKAVAQRSDMMGVKSSKTLKDLTKLSYALGNAFQLDAKVISREVGEAMKDMAHFGTTTTKSLTESVTFAHRFGLELKDIVGVLDKYLSFDDAAEGAANLSQAFGANIDSFALMKASAEGDVGKSLEILRKSFRDAGIDATQFTAVDRKLIAQNTGLSDAAVQAAFSLKKQSIGLDQVQKVGDKAVKSTMTQEEAMQRLADAIERIVHSGMGMKGGFWDQWFAGIQAGIMSSKEFYGLMRNIQMALRQTYMIGLKLGRDLVKIVPGFGELLGGLKDFFAPGHFAKMFQNISDTIRRFFDPKSPDKGNVPRLFDGLKKSVVDMFTSEGSAGKRIIEGFKTFMGMLSKAAADVIKWMSDKLAEGIDYMVDLLTGKKTLDLSSAAGGGKGALGFLYKVIQPLGEALAHAWVVLKDPLWRLVNVLFDKLVDFLKSDAVIRRVKPAVAGIAVILFGPAFIRAVMASLTASLVKGAVNALTSDSGKKAVNDLAGKAVQATEAAQKVPSKAGTESLEKVGEVNKAGEKAIDGGKGWGVKDAVALGLKLIAIATALAVGGVEMALSVVAIKKILDAGGIKGTKDAGAPLLVLGAMAIASVPLAMALRLVSKAGNIKDVLLGGLIITAAVSIVGAVGAGITYLLKKVGTPAEMSAAGNLMLKMSGVFLAMVPLIAASIALGALATGPQAIALAAAAVGMGVIGLAVSEMASIAVGVAKELSVLKIDADFQRKIDAFLGIMKSIQAFTDAIVKVIELMTPSLSQFLLGNAEMFVDKANAAKSLIAEMVGTRGGGKGIIGLVEIVLESVKQLVIGEGVAEKAQIFGSVLQAVSATLTAMTPPQGFFDAGSSFMAQLNGPQPFQNLAVDIAFYMSQMRDGMLTMINGDKQGKGGIIDIVEKLGAVKLPDTKAAESVSSLLTSISSVMKAMTPSGDALKAFTVTAEQSVASLGPLKVGAATVSSLDTEGLGKALDAMGGQLQKLLPALTTGVLSGVLAQTKDMSPEQLDRLKMAAEVLRAAVDAGRLVSEAVKEGDQPSLVNPATIDKMTSILPVAFVAVANLQKQIGDVISAGSLRAFGRNMTDLSNVIRGEEQGKSGIVGALRAVSDMVKQANELDKALADGNVNKIDVKAKLERVAKAVGLGGKASYTVDTGKNVVITVNMQVVMNAAEVEKAIIFNKTSIITDRINFATQRTNPPGSDIITRDVEPQYPLQERSP